MPDGSTRTWHSRERWCLVALGLAFLLQIVVLYRPERVHVTHFPLAVPDPFIDVPRFRSGALLLLFAVGVLTLLGGAMKLRALVAHPRLAVCGVYLFGVALHVAFLASLAGTPLAMERRAIVSWHGEYLTEAVIVGDLAATLRNYEPYVRDRIYLANKGPGVLALFRGLSVVANAAPMRGVLEAVAPDRLPLRWWLAERGNDLTGPQMDQLRHLLALMFVLYPLVTLLPVFLIAWVGHILVDDVFALLSAVLYTLVPAVALLVAHLDYALFPLCAIGIVAPFVVGVHTKRPGLVAVSALVFVAYFTLTLAAVSVLVLLGSYLAFMAIRRVRQAVSVKSIARDVASAAAVFVVTAGVAMAIASWGLSFHPLERYSAAREIQQNWTSADYGFFWVTTNLLGYFLSFGLMQALLLFLQQGSAVRRTVRATSDAIDDLALAWMCLLIALAAFGRNHGETNRIWAFLSPMACLVIARYFYDRLSTWRLWVPVVAAFGAVVLVRYRLSYF